MSVIKLKNKQQNCTSNKQVKQQCMQLLLKFVMLAVDRTCTFVLFPFLAVKIQSPSAHFLPVKLYRNTHHY